ncbi:MAG TPA: GNAT family N-acetyltransferase [Sedimentisphaerales bacterium]|nr:GNAT family N-acetyltransferase [Sedimentisphaerales bacterium]
MLRILPAKTDKDLEAAKSLFYEYADFLKSRFGDCVDPDWADRFRQRFEEEVNGLPGQYTAPDGCLLVAEYQGRVAGCVALRKLSDGVCEMRRLFVRHQFRSLGIGKALAQAVIDHARDLRYRSMRLETNRLLKAATGLYASFGFKEISPYHETPVPEMVCMEFNL